MEAENLSLPDGVLSNGFTFDCSIIKKEDDSCEYQSLGSILDSNDDFDRPTVKVENTYSSDFPDIMGELGKEYQVVEFILTTEVATVHKSWMKNNEKGKLSCCWPERDQKKLAARHVAPEAGWTEWDVRILASSDDFQAAIKMEKKAEFTSDVNSDKDDRGKKRTRKPPRKFFDSSSESDDATIKIRKKKATKQSSSSSAESDLPTRMKTPVPVEPPTPKAIPSSTHSKRTLSSPGSSVMDIETVTNSSPDLMQFICFFKSKIESLERTMQKVKYDVKEVLEMQSLIMKGQTQNDSKDLQTEEFFEFSNKFPLENVNQMMELDNSLGNEENAKMLVKLVKQIGGISLEDNVKRVCVRLFTNEVASHFSWEGRKGKLPLNNLKIIKTIGRSLSTGPHKDVFTSKVFEFRLREWFRQAQTRIRGKKQKPIEGQEL